MTSSTLRRIVRQSLASASPGLLQAVRATRRWVLNRRSRGAVFGEIYRSNAWGSSESVSGPGSTLERTAKMRRELGDLLERLGVRTLLDIPCGDLTWIPQTLPEGTKYIGADIVPDLIDRNVRDHAGVGTFLVADLATDRLPQADLILVRDCLIHLPNAMVRQCLSNIRASDITWLLTTTYQGIDANQDIELGGFRPVQLELAPFALPAPAELLREFDDPAEEDGKSLGLWRVADLPR